MKIIFERPPAASVMMTSMRPCLKCKTLTRAKRVRARVRE